MRPLYTCRWAKRRLAASDNPGTVMFWGHRPSRDGNITKSCLSQWWRQSFKVNGETFCCAEQYMMACKARLFGDEETRRQIMETSDPKAIKELGRKVANFDRNIWDCNKYAIVVAGNLCKFRQNHDLAEYLLSTDDAVLIEASPYDQVWGIGLSQDSPEAHNPALWHGENLLGFALMEVRDDLRSRILSENAEKLATPFGEIAILLDGRPIPYCAHKGEKFDILCPDVLGRFQITIQIIPDGREHNLSCTFKPSCSYQTEIESGEWLELHSFYNEERYKMSIGVEYEEGQLPCGDTLMDAYDYYADSLVNGMAYEIAPETTTTRYTFGICWIDGVERNGTEMDESRDIQTFYGADPLYWLKLPD